MSDGKLRRRYHYDHARLAQIARRVKAAGGPDLYEDVLHIEDWADSKEIFYVLPSQASERIHDICNKALQDALEENSAKTDKMLEEQEAEGEAEMAGEALASMTEAEIGFSVLQGGTVLPSLIFYKPAQAENKFYKHNSHLFDLPADVAKFYDFWTLQAVANGEHNREQLKIPASESVLIDMLNKSKEKEQKQLSLANVKDKRMCEQLDHRAPIDIQSAAAVLVPTHRRMPFVTPPNTARCGMPLPPPQSSALAQHGEYETTPHLNNTSAPSKKARTARACPVCRHDNRGCTRSVKCKALYKGQVVELEGMSVAFVSKEKSKYIFEIQSGTAEAPQVIERWDYHLETKERLPKFPWLEIATGYCKTAAGSPHGNLVIGRNSARSQWPLRASTLEPGTNNMHVDVRLAKRAATGSKQKNLLPNRAFAAALLRPHAPAPPSTDKVLGEKSASWQIVPHVDGTLIYVERSGDDGPRACCVCSSPNSVCTIQVGAGDGDGMHMYLCTIRCALEYTLTKVKEFGDALQLAKV
jgi:hypothetical protein